MLTRAEVEERLKGWPSESDAKWFSVNEWVELKRQREALETAQQLAKWLETFADWADLACANDIARNARAEASAWLEGRR